jgi:hypothetical protein
MIKRIPYLLLVVLMTACSSIDCPVDATVTTQYQIKNSDGTEHTLSDTMTVTSVRSDGKDTILYNKGIGISKFTLPVSYTHPEDVLVFQFDNSNNNLHITDTLWIKKYDYPHFESVDCNTTYFHTITDVKYTCNYIDSIVINNSSVTYDSQTVHLYLYPKSND